MTLIHHVDADLLWCVESGGIALPITQTSRVGFRIQSGKSWLFYEAALQMVIFLLHW